MPLGVQDPLLYIDAALEGLGTMSSRNIPERDSWNPLSPCGGGCPVPTVSISHGAMPLSFSGYFSRMILNQGQTALRGEPGLFDYYSLG